MQKKNSTYSSRLATGLILTALLSPAPMALAMDNAWTGEGGDENWSTALNWLLGTPAENQDLWIAENSKYVIFDIITSPNFNKLTLSSNTTLLQNSNALKVQGSEGLFTVGANSNDDASFYFSGGTVDANSLTVGNQSGSTGTVNISGNATLNVTGNMLIGLTGNGSVIQAGASSVNADTLVLAEQGTENDGFYALISGTLTTGISYIGGWDSTSGDAEFTQQGGTHTSNRLILGRGSSGSNTYELFGGSLIANELIIGDQFSTSSGELTQKGFSTATIGTLTVGDEGTGTYNLKQGTLHVTGDEYLGKTGSGSGTFNQSGGKHRVDGSLYVDVYEIPTKGAYNLSAGTLTVANNTVVGSSGTGRFAQTGGSHTTTSLILGDQTTGFGTSEIGGATSTLNAGWIDVGRVGTGSFTQSGGSVFVNNNLVLGRENGSYGSYTLSEGTLQTGETHVAIESGDGNSWISGGEFNQSGGSHTTGALVLGYNTGSYGLYRLSGGDLISHGNEQIGLSGGGYFEQSGGTNTIDGTLILGQEVASYGQYTLIGPASLYASHILVGGGGGGFFAQSEGFTKSNLLHITNNGWAELYSAIMQLGNLNVDGSMVAQDSTLNANDIQIDGGNFLQTGGFIQSANINIQNLGYFLTDGEVSTKIMRIANDGQVTQSGGNTDIADILFIGDHDNSSGTYNLEGGTLSVVNSDSSTGTGDYEWIGLGGTGTFNHTGGTHNALNIGLGSPGNEWHNGGVGTYNLSGSDSLLSVTETELVGVNGIGIFNHSGGTNTANNLIVGTNNNGNTTGVGTYNLTTGSLTTNYELIGFDNGQGSFIQSGGSNTINNFLGIGQEYGEGAYIQSAGNVYANSEGIGLKGGHGRYEQSGGSNTIAGFLGVGNLDGDGTYIQNGGDVQAYGEGIGLNGGIGRYEQSAGSNTITNFLGVGNLDGDGTYIQNGGDVHAYGEGIGLKGGIGRYEQSGGSNTITDSLAIGNSGEGTYSLSGENSLLSIIKNEIIGTNSGSGVLSQSGGTNTIGEFLRIGAGGSGTYNLSGENSQLIVGTFQAIGSYGGTGVFNHTGGINSVKNGTLYVGGSGNGTYNLSGSSSQLHAYQSEIIGNTGTGVFNQDGGTHIVDGSLTISETPGASSGTYNLNDGTLQVTSGITNNGTLNYSGGSFNANLINNDGGAFNVNGSGTRIVNGDVTNYGTIKTTDTTVHYTGTFTNYGAYISDPSTQYFENLIIADGGYLVGGSGDTWVIADDFIISDHYDATQWNTLEAELIFSGSGDHTFQFAGTQTWNSLDLSGGDLIFSGTGGTLYVDSILGLTLDPTTGLVTNITGSGSGGFTIYYDPLNLENAYLNGESFQIAGGGFLQAQSGSPVPVPSTLLLFGASIACLAAANRKPSRG